MEHLVMFTRGKSDQPSRMIGWKNVTGRRLRTGQGGRRYLGSESQHCPSMGSSRQDQGVSTSGQQLSPLQTDRAGETAETSRQFSIKNNQIVNSQRNRAMKSST